MLVHEFNHDCTQVSEQYMRFFPNNLGLGMGKEEKAHKEISRLPWVKAQYRFKTYYHENSIGDTKEAKYFKRKYAFDLLTSGFIEFNAISYSALTNWLDRSKFSPIDEVTSEVLGEIEYDIVKETESSFSDIKSLYTLKTFNLPDVKAILSEEISGVIKITTFLKDRNIQTREKIYKTEMELLTLYHNKQIQFSIFSLSNTKGNIDNFLSNKEILYYT